jgi:predicted dehydrogenase
MNARSLRVGMVGAGFVSQHHLMAWRKLAGQAQVVAIADPSDSAARNRAAAFAIPAVYGQAWEMVKAEKLDALDVSAPREVHAEMVGLAADHGLAVLCQKPLAPTLSEAEELAAKVAGSTRLMVHENWRFRPYYRHARQWLVDGAIGGVRQCVVEVLTSGFVPDGQGRLPALERQPFMQTLPRMLVMEVLIHHIDTLRFLLGPLKLKNAILTRSCGALDGEDGATVLMKTASDGAVTVFGSMSAAGYPTALIDRMVIVGECGTIRLEDGLLSLHGRSRQEEVRYDLATAYQDSYDATIRHFTEGVLTGAPFETAPADNLETLRLVEAAYAMNWQ